MFLRKIRKYGSDDGWVVEWPLKLSKSSIVPIAAGLAVAITIEISQRKAFFQGVKETDEMIIHDGINK